MTTATFVYYDFRNRLSLDDLANLVPPTITRPDSNIKNSLSIGFDTDVKRSKSVLSVLEVSPKTSVVLTHSDDESHEAVVDILSESESVGLSAETLALESGNEATKNADQEIPEYVICNYNDLQQKSKEEIQVERKLSSHSCDSDISVGNMDAFAFRRNRYLLYSIVDFLAFKYLAL